MMKQFSVSAAAMALCVGGFAVGGMASAQLTEQQAATARQDDQGTTIKPASVPHYDAAQKAGKDFPGLLAICNASRPAAFKWKSESGAFYRGMTGPDAKAPAPAKIFDNFYFLGNGNVTAWALDTPEGIIVIDTLDNGKEAAELIEGGLRKLGADPARIKYIVVTHGHGDHFGGADYLRKTFGAHVMMSDYDWTLAPTMLDKPTFDPPPPRDLVIKDGDSLTLGGQTLRFFITPGHTPGTVSLLIPVKDRGKPHTIALYGGIGMNFRHTPANFDIYSSSALRFRGEAQKAKADVVLTNHPENDLANLKAAKISQRGAKDANPFVQGPGAVQNFLTVLSECALAYKGQVSG